jgi:Zn-finger protein
MTEFDIKADNKAFIKEILKDYNRSIFNDYIKNYPKLPKPTHDELADTLSNHALLDRKQHDNIGFVIELILGILIGRNLIEKKYQEHHPTSFTNIITQDFAYLAISAFKVQPQERRDSLWDVLYSNTFPYDNKFKFYRDFYLKNKFIDKYNEVLIEDISFTNIDFVAEALFKNSIISNCKFFNCRFNRLSFDNSGFVNCKFYDCHWEGNSLERKSNMYITGCESNNNFDCSLYEGLEWIETQIDVEELIFRKFIRSASKINSMKRLSSIRESLRGLNVGILDIEKAISSLKKKAYIVINGDNCFIQREGITYFNRTYNHE